MSLNHRKIIKDKIEHNQRLFLLNDCNDWLSFERLLSDHCLFEYCITLISERKSTNTFNINEFANRIYDLLGEVTESCLDLLRKQYLTLQGLTLPRSKKYDILQNIEKLFEKNELEKTELENLRRDILVEKLILKKIALDENLKISICLINMISDNRKKIGITNDVDFSHFPSFIYVNHNINPAKDTPALKCQCQNNNQCNMKGCYHYFQEKSQNKKIPLKDVGMPYDQNERILLEPQIPVFECNRFCSCDENCPKRVVQRGPNVSLEIFRTWNNCGWGVRALENIPKGTFLAVYAGEIISHVEANTRANNLYLFDLDFKYDDKKPYCPYTIDSFKYGNYSRFFNHSCTPNVTVHCIYINNIHGEMPELAFFSNRDIACGEELCFKYSSEMNKTNCRCSTHNIL